MQPSPFHLAFPVKDLEQAKTFFAQILGCPIGRRSDHWIDFDFFGNQITAHLSPISRASSSNQVETLAVPVPHFGAILPWQAFHQLATRLEKHQVHFIHKPTIRFQGQVGEQATMFLSDGNDNVLEFKSFKDPKQVFAAETP